LQHLAIRAVFLEQRKIKRRANCLTQRRKGRKGARVVCRIQTPRRDVIVSSDFGTDVFATATAATLCFCCSHSPAVLRAFAALAPLRQAVAVKQLPSSRCRQAVAVKQLPSSRCRQAVAVKQLPSSRCRSAVAVTPLP